MEIDDWVKKEDLHLPLLLERLQYVLAPVNAQLLIIINAQHQENLWSEFIFPRTTENEITRHKFVRNQTSQILLLTELLTFQSFMWPNTQCFII